tara:strand:+ start:228 stop:566 length:339 start_codon:yes stop_codon:yes gene_type:complete
MSAEDVVQVCPCFFPNNFVFYRSLTLMISMIMLHFMLLQLFVKYGARLDLTAGQGGPMPLLCAVVRRSLTLAAALITMGASQTLVDSRGMSASIVAGNLRPNGKTIQRILLG